MELKKTKEGMVVMSKDRLTKESDWPHDIHVECDDGCEASVEKLRDETCEVISKKNIPVEDADPGYCHGDIAIGENRYKGINLAAISTASSKFIIHFLCYLSSITDRISYESNSEITFFFFSSFMLEFALYNTILCINMYS